MARPVVTTLAGGDADSLSVSTAGRSPDTSLTARKSSEDLQSTRLDWCSGVCPDHLFGHTQANQELLRNLSRKWGSVESFCFEPPVLGLVAFFQLIHFLLDTTRKANTGGDSQLETLGWCSGTPNQLFGHKKARQPLLRSSHVRGSLGKNVLCSHFTRQGSDSPIGTGTTDVKIETSAAAIE